MRIVDIEETTGAAPGRRPVVKSHELPANLLTELGYEADPTWGGLPTTPTEENPDFIWPQSLKTISAMRRNPKVAAAETTISMPVLANRYRLGTAGRKSKNLVAALEVELGLNDDEEAPLNPERGIDFQELLTHVLLALSYGHSPFELVWRPGDALPGQPGRPDGYVHLHRAAPRLPWTINGWDITPDGKLDAIYQHVPIGMGRFRAKEDPRFASPGSGIAYAFEPHRLDSYEGRGLFVPTWGKLGGNWLGQSLWRSVYVHYKLLGLLWKVEGESADRQGMGLVTVGYGSDIAQEDAEQVATDATAGAKSGVAYPKGDGDKGMEVDLLGVEGKTFDLMPAIRYHGEEILAIIVAQHLTLGHDKGAQSLADTLVREHNKFLNMVQQWVCDQITEGIIRPWVALNYGPTQPYPRLIADPITIDFTPSPEALLALQQADLLRGDEPLRQEIRRRSSLPDEASDALPPVAQQQVDHQIEQDEQPDEPVDPRDPAADPKGQSA